MTKRMIYDLLWITILWSRVGWFANNLHEWRSHEWKLFANHLTSDRNSLFTPSRISFYFLHALNGARTTEKSMKTAIDRSPRHFLFTVGQSIVLLWRIGNTYCDVILTDYPQTVSTLVTCVFPPSSSWLSFVNNRVRFHGLACNKMGNTF